VTAAAALGAWRESTMRVRYAETDRMGVAYHAEYFVWFEVGRTDWIRNAPAGRAGEASQRSYRQMEEAGYFLPVIEASSRYHCPARYDDELLVRTALTEASRARVTFDYEVVRRSDGRLLATGRSAHAVTDREGRACRLPPAWLAWLTGDEAAVAAPSAAHEGT
jgi:acyl-CoA thioester hydrolase